MSERTGWQPKVADDRDKVARTCDPNQPTGGSSLDVTSFLPKPLTRSFQQLSGADACTEFGQHVESLSSHANQHGAMTCSDNVRGIQNEGQPNAFAKLVRGWEDYLNDTQGDTFPSLQMLQDLQLCGPLSRASLARLAGLPGYPSQFGQFALPALPEHAVVPPTLRHTHSSPLKYGASMFGDNEENYLPPIPLDPFQRSSSTPSSFRHRSTSAFGSVGNSAFSLPSQRSSYTSIGDPSSRYSAFDPVTYYERAFDEMEQTAIEVTDVTPDKESDNVQSTAALRGPRAAASRAARFLSDVRILRRRRRLRKGGRDNLTDSASGAEADQDSETRCSRNGLDTSVTIITDGEPNPESSFLSQSSEVSAILNKMTVDDEGRDEKSIVAVYSSPLPDSDHDDKEATTPKLDRQYHQLDSDVDEEELHFQRIDASFQTESPGSVPSPPYQQMEDEPASREGKPTRKIRIQVPAQNKLSSSDDGPNSNLSSIGMTREGSTTPRSNDSLTISPGGTTRSGSASDHVTQVTFSSASVGQHSALSTISETDREVMEANKDAKKRRRMDDFPSKIDSEIESLNSSSTNSTNPDGYLPITASPAPLREGANVPAERFFTNSPGTSNGSAAPSASVRFQFPLSNVPRAPSGSPGTLETSSVTHTSSSSANSSLDVIPPKFVSYFDRQFASDLTSLREDIDTVAARGGADEREPSPAEMVGFPEVLFEMASTAKAELASRIIPNSSGNGRPDKIRARPPRSPCPRTPVKGMRPSTTPPPRGNLSPVHHHSPPRHIVDQPTSTISRPNVMRTDASLSQQFFPGASTSNILNSWNALMDATLWAEQETKPTELKIPARSSPVVVREDEMPDGGRGHMRGRTYEDGTIEIFKVDSKEESTTPSAGSGANRVTPEKDGKH